MDKGFDATYRNKLIIACTTGSADDAITILEDFAEKQGNVDFYKSKKDEYKVMMVDKEERFEAVFEVLRLKDEDGYFSYFVHLTKEQGDLLAFNHFANAARAFLE